MKRLDCAKEENITRMTNEVNRPNLEPKGISHILDAVQLVT